MNIARFFRTLGPVAALVAAALALPGCVIPKYLALQFPEKEDALYELGEGKTLILVDDPDMQLGERNLVHVIAGTIQQNMAENDVKTPIVDQQALRNLRVSLGDKFESMPIDQIGKELGATQVIHIHIDNIDWNAGAAPVAQPRASALVKVVSTDNGKRLFPKGVAGVPLAQQPSRGAFPVLVETKLQTVGDDPRYALAATQARIIAELARRSGELFYRHEKDREATRQGQFVEH